jgi:hypothetical protein
MPSILSLPNEALLEIIEKNCPLYDGLEFLYNLSLVCKRFRELSLPRLYREVHL